MMEQCRGSVPETFISDTGFIASVQKVCKEKLWFFLRMSQFPLKTVKTKEIKAFLKKIIMIATPLQYRVAIQSHLCKFPTLFNDYYAKAIL